MDQHTYTIRRAKPEDAQALAKVHERTWRETYAGLLTNDLLDALTADARAEAWSRILTRRTGYLSRTYVAQRAGGMLVAFGSCGDQRDADFAAGGYDGEIAAVYVLKTDQRRGVGTLLMRTMIEDLVEHGAKSFTLWVPRENIPARSLYEQMGGKLIGQRSNAHAEGELAEVAYGWPPAA